MRGITVAICTLVVLSMLPAVHLDYSARAQSAGDTVCSAENGDACYNTSVGPIFTLPPWADANDWTEASYYSTIQLADIDGDGTDELLARGPDGISVQKWDAADGHAVWNQITGSGPLADSDGWDRPEYYATIQTADIDGDGSAELLGRGKDGLYTYSWNGTGWDLLKSDDPAWTNDGGWDKPEYYETIQTADIDGDQAAELLARDADGLNTYRWNGSGWDQIGTERPAWSDAYGWNAPQYYQTIQAGDIDGDGAEEILARGTAGIESYDWSGGAWNLIKAGSPNWNDTGGWDQPQYYLTIQTADVNGDNRDELLGRTATGIDTYEWNGSSWQLLQKATPDWKDATGWNAPQYYRTIQTGDIDGDGAAELLARSSSGIDTYHWVDGGWSQVGANNPTLSDDHWTEAGNFLTIQTGDINGDGDADLVARGLYGVRTWSWNEVSANAWDNPTAYGLPIFTGSRLTAYDFVGTFLTIHSGQTVRDQYTTDPTTLGNYKGCLFFGADENAWNDWTEIPTETCNDLGDQTPITPPSGMTLEDWNSVAEQLYNELAEAESVSSYFSDLQSLYSAIYANEQSMLTSTALTLFGEDMSKQKVDAFWQNLFLVPFKLAPLGGPVSSAVGASAAALISGGLNLESSDSFEGTWADAQTQYTTLSQQNEDAISAGHAFVAGDATLLSYVALQKSSGAWDPADAWVNRYLTSTGRKQFSLWVMQTLAPSVWNLRYSSFGSQEACTSIYNQPPDKIDYYFVGANSSGICYAQVRDASTDTLHTILDLELLDTCVPTRDNTATWESGTCSLGISKDDFFLNRNGWNFKVSYLCEENGQSGGCVGGGTAEMIVQPGSSNQTINQEAPGSVPVAILSNDQFDATQIDVSTLELEGATSAGWWADEGDLHPSRIRDVNGDGYDDVVVSFPISDLMIEAGTQTVLLTGQLNDGTWFSLWDTVEVVPGPA